MIVDTTGQIGLVPTAKKWPKPVGLPSKRRSNCSGAAGSAGDPAEPGIRAAQQTSRAQRCLAAPLYKPRGWEFRPRSGDLSKGSGKPFQLILVDLRLPGPRRRGWEAVLRVYGRYAAGAREAGRSDVPARRRLNSAWSTPSLLPLQQASPAWLAGLISAGSGVGGQLDAASPVWMDLEQSIADS